jgi:hypothetical protein
VNFIFDVLFLILAADGINWAWIQLNAGATKEDIYRVMTRMNESKENETQPSNSLQKRS